MYETGHWETNDFTDKVVNARKAVATTGAKELLDFVHQHKGFVSLVSNRYGNEDGALQSTIENLKQQGIYFDQVILANGECPNAHDKNERFEAVVSGDYSNDKCMVFDKTLPAHSVIAYFGDNIQDFPHLKQADMKDASIDMFSKFGKEYFIFPNPMYGSWEKN